MTKRQQLALDFIRAYIGEHGLSPSYDEIKDALGYASKGPAFSIVSRLSNDGYIEYENRRGARNIRLANVKCPACGAVICRQELERAA